MSEVEVDALPPWASTYFALGNSLIIHSAKRVVMAVKEDMGMPQVERLVAAGAKPLQVETSLHAESQDPDTDAWIRVWEHSLATTAMLL